MALRGGGIHGVYEAGALKALVEVLEPFEVAYDIVSGVSVGALNSALLAVHPRGEEKKAVEEMVSLYENTKFDDMC